jgi:two-component system NtrC family sensor kinase
LHREHLWEPLGLLHEMVWQVRRGNLNVSAPVPRSLEVGPLVESFLQLTAEVREMRESLEQKVAERTAELEAAQSQLLQAAKLSAMGQLVSGVAHEVNNPLTSVLGFSEILLGNPKLTPQARGQLETIRDEALRLKKVVAGLSTFARRGPQRTERLDVRRVLDKLVELRKYQLTAGGIRLHVERPAQAAWVDGDADQLLQVLFNLVLNAEQAIQEVRETGDIWLGCETVKDEVHITVRDNGAGMKPEVVERIFEPFFTTKPVGQGTGLGLSISHGIVAQHRGRFLVGSTPGEGTTLCVVLPRIEAPQPEQPHALASELPAEPAGGRALIIDDEAQIVALVQQALEARGWSTVTVTDSTAVESLLDGTNYDVVICDLKMPGKTGFDVLNLLRKKRPELARRFLLMTGDLGDTDKRRLLEAHARVLRKPFTLAQLREAVQSLRQTES